MDGEVTGIIWQKAIVDAMLSALSTIPAAKLLTTPTLDLYTDAHIPDPVNDTIASFTKPTWGGYAGVALGALVGPNNLDAHNGMTMIGEAMFTCTGPGPGTSPGYSVANGIFLSDGVANLYGQAAFVTPAPIAAAGDWIDVDALLCLLFRQGA